MLDRMYCASCKKTFPDYMETRAREKTITVGQFMYNQQRIMWDEPIEFTGNKRIFQVSCPHCNSIRTINMQAVALGEITIYSRRIMIGDNKEDLQKIGKKMKKNGEIVGYIVQQLKHGYALYELLRLKRKFKKMLCDMKAQPLNTMNDITRYGDRK